MGCDYDDPSREWRDRNWTRNNKLINASDCKRIAGSIPKDYVACCACGAMIWTGDLREERDLPFVRVHRHWHEQMRLM